MSRIKAADLIDYFKVALREKWGYIYGMSYESWTANKQIEYVKKYEGDPDRQNSCKYGMKWVGHIVTDCSGLFKWAFRKLGSDIAHGSNSIWDKYTVSRGRLINGHKVSGYDLLPGTAVFTSTGERHNHIGLYIGNDTVIEAQGAEAGVVTSSISNKKWTHWGELMYVEYDSEKREEKPVMLKATVVLPEGASGSTVNLRSSTNKSSAIICKVPVGSTVDVETDLGLWCCVVYGNNRGYMMSNYLEYDGQDGESGDAITPEECEKIETALTTIEEQIEVIRSTLGRG